MAGHIPEAYFRSHSIEEMSRLTSRELEKLGRLVFPVIAREGDTHYRRVSWAEAYDIALALHCPLGPIALAANLQLDAVCYNAFIQEQSLGIHYNTTNDLLDYLVDPSVFAYRDGYVAIPQGPGLGIEVNEEFVVRMAETGHRWRNPVWRHADGSFAEW